MTTAAGPKATSFPKDQIKVLLLENIHTSAQQIFANEHFQVEALKQALKEEELIEKISDVHVLGIRSKTHVTERVLAAGKRLLSVGCFCIGTNQVDLGAANRRGVPVFNAPFSNTRSVAELIISEIIALSRKLTERSQEVHAGTWNKASVDCNEVRNKTLGIIGYGHIGRQLGVLAEAMGIRVIFFDISSKLPMGNNRVVATLDELLAEADYVSLHVPATPQTKNMIGARELGLMRKGTYLLNASRGTVVDIPALAAALKSGHLGGAAIDVFPQEPESNSDPFKSELQGLKNVILTPHVGGSTSEAQEMIGREVGTSLTRYVNAGATTGAVNFPAIELPVQPGKHRILNVHRNVPGVLGEINGIVSRLKANIQSQVLATDPETGYLIMDLDQDVSNEVRHAIGELPTNVRTRILY
ncbi:MAG TPA: phosphoglycerate dehydrogenase [Polyangiaceae bacterium]|nr:phosphoglycerate dehydrogenase [Polyangiaceae bacterium]